MPPQVEIPACIPLLRCRSWSPRRKIRSDFPERLVIYWIEDVGNRIIVEFHSEKVSGRKEAPDAAVARVAQKSGHNRKAPPLPRKKGAGDAGPRRNRPYVGKAYRIIQKQSVTPQVKTPRSPPPSSISAESLIVLYLLLNPNKRQTKPDRVLKRMYL